MNQNQEEIILSEFLHSIGPWQPWIVIGGLSWKCKIHLEG